MLFEIAQPVSLLLCVLSLYRVFHVAFLEPAAAWNERILASAGMLAISAAICLVSGMIFCEGYQDRDTGIKRFTSTLPVQLFCWAASLMVLLFLAAWYLETNCIFYRDVRRL